MKIKMYFHLLALVIASIACAHAAILMRIGRILEVSSILANTCLLLFIWSVAVGRSNRCWNQNAWDDFTKQPKIYYCGTCKRLVKGFDHHCFFLVRRALMQVSRL